jgi:uncharacterized protein (UPF0147 family)
MTLHSVQPLRTESTDSRIERALHMLTDLMADQALPADWRKTLAPVHADLHARRSPERVARMEREQHIEPRGGDAA